MLFNKKYKSGLRQKGFTAIELMFALGVIAFGTVALVLVSRNNTNKQNANIMVSDVSALVQNIQSGFASSSTGYTGLENTSAISMGLVPSDLKFSTAAGSSTINSKFTGGTVTIAAVGTDAFSIAYTNVPTSVCNSVITTLGGSAFTKVEVGGTTVFENDTGANTPLSPASVGTACSSSSTVDITFTAS
jgi:type II secretory pathway pseudopilin PulG